MSIKKKLNKNFFKKEYFNILYSLIMPSFVVGQVAFKIILILIILSSLISFNFKIFSINKNKLNFLFFVLILYLIFNSLLISNIYHEYNNRYLTFIGIFLFYLTSDYAYKNKIINLKYIFKIQILFFFLIYIDTIYQIIFLKDLFGYDYYFAYDRFAGPFGDEFILGSFMSFFLIPCFLIYSKDKFHLLSNKIFLIIFGLISIYIALKTGERIAFMTILLQIFLLITIFNFKHKSRYILLTISSLCIAIPILASDESIKKKYTHFYQILFNYESLMVDNKKENVQINPIGFFNSQTGAHFLTAAEIWKNYPIFGVGVKNFRYESQKDYYSKIKSHHAMQRSSTHPHNFQLELLSETGLLGFLLFNTFLIFIFYKVIYKIKENKNKNYLLIIFSIIILSKYFPIKTDSSLYSSSLGLLFWIFIVYLLIQINNKLIS